MQAPRLAADASRLRTAFGDFVTSIMLFTRDPRPISLEILRQADAWTAAAHGVMPRSVTATVFFLPGGTWGAIG